MTSPTSFTGSPSHQVHHPPPTPPQPPGGVSGRPAPEAAADPAAMLSISQEGVCILSKSLQVAARLRGGQHVHLVAPRLRGHTWYLDTNPKPGVGTQLPTQGRARFRTGPIALMHFQVSRPAVPGFVPGSITNSFAHLLHFVLGPEVEGHPGYFRLLARPVNH